MRTRRLAAASETMPTLKTIEVNTAQVYEIFDEYQNLRFKFKTYRIGGRDVVVVIRNWAGTQR